MIKNLQAAKREVFSLIVIIIIVTFLISTLANVVFTEYYKNHTEYFVYGVSIALFFFAVLSYVLLTASLSSTTTKVKMNFTYDRENDRFLDIPYCPSSVNARVLFDKLSREHQKHIGSCAYLNKFSDSVLSIFLDNVVQMILLTNVLNSADRFLEEENLSKLKFEDMPVNVKDNKYIQQRLEEYEYINIMHNYKISSIDSRERYFKIDGAHGSISFTWSLSMIQTAYNSGAYLESIEDVNRDNCCDFYMTVTMTSELSYLRLLSSKTQIFANWAHQMANDLKSYDWARAESMLPLLMIGQILNKIQNNQ